MNTNDFNFELPQHLIAQYPSEHRGQSRLMTLDRVTGKREHRTVAQLPEILCGESFLSPHGEKPLLVFNDSRVRKARVIGTSLKSNAQTEFLLLEALAASADSSTWKALAKRRKSGSYVFHDANGAEAASAEITGTHGEYLTLQFDRVIDDAWLDKHGHIPLPPYIAREDSPQDEDRYQTVYAKEAGSAAAPTAGLHFTTKILSSFAERGIETAFLTLHVGLGTFLPVRSEKIEDHQMHEETFYLDEKTAAQIEAAKAAGRKVVAVGTTSVRTLESAWINDKLQRGAGETSIFIYPGYQFKVVDALFTNFHTPLSTLLMLVSAFAGKELILESYAEAVREEYRFFSYGDAMIMY